MKALKNRLKREDRTDAYGRNVSSGYDSEGAEAAKQRHRKSYEEYFEGYTEKTVVNEAGRKIRCREYTGTLFYTNMTDSQRRQTKALYAALLIAAAILDTAALTLPIWSSHNVWAFTFGCAPIVVYVWMMFPLFTYLTAGPELKIYEYNKGALPLTRIALPTLICSAAAIVAGPVLILIYGERFQALEALRMAMYALSAAFTCGIGAIEKKIKYDSKDSK